MSLPATLLLATLVAQGGTVTPHAIVLRSGKTIPVSGAIRREGTNLVFTSNGTLFSLPADEVDATQTEKLAAAENTTVSRPGGAASLPQAERDRILRELERRYAVPATQKREKAPPRPTAKQTATPLLESVDVSAPADRESQRREERSWREQAHFHDEQVRRREEDLALLKTHIQQLEDQILSLLSLGYDPSQFAMQVYQLQRNRDEVDQAQLELTRARREREQFLDDARREGVLPGWLR